MLLPSAGGWVICHQQLQENLSDGTDSLSVGPHYHVVFGYTDARSRKGVAQAYIDNANTADSDRRFVLQVT
jgi:hypothetical protein